jgi:hypothetical protein
VARLLIQHNANVNLQDNVSSFPCDGGPESVFFSTLHLSDDLLQKGYTALMWMAETGNKEGVLIIMQSGKADSTLRAKVRSKRSALHLI